MRNCWKAAGEKGWVVPSHHTEEHCRYWDFLHAFIIFIINRKSWSVHIRLKLATTEEYFNGHSEDKQWSNLSIIHRHLPGPPVKCFAYLNNLIQRLKLFFHFSTCSSGGLKYDYKSTWVVPLFHLSHNKTAFQNVFLLKRYYWSFSFASLLW